MSDIWRDPMVMEALKERPPSDIWVMECNRCGQKSYWNEGSHFSCRFCKTTVYVTSEMADEAIRLDDTITEVTDGYENHTL